MLHHLKKQQGRFQVLGCFPKKEIITSIKKSTLLDQGSSFEINLSCIKVVNKGLKISGSRRAETDNKTKNIGYKNQRIRYWQILYQSQDKSKQSA